MTIKYHEPTSSELQRLRAEYKAGFLEWTMMEEDDPAKPELEARSHVLWAEIQEEVRRLAERVATRHA